MIELSKPVITTLIFIFTLVAIPLLVIVVYLTGGICIVFFNTIRTIKKTIKKCKNRMSLNRF
jgi:uncharacterized protein YneF (UPF0154 family)